MAVGIGVASALLVFAFDDLDLQAILDAIRSLTDAELLSLISTTGIVVWSEALLLATFVPGLPARRGAMAWLGPTAVSSVVPGPSDLPMIYRMFTSWGQSGRRRGDVGGGRQPAQHRPQAGAPGARRDRPGRGRHPDATGSSARSSRSR